MTLSCTFLLPLSYRLMWSCTNIVIIVHFVFAQTTCTFAYSEYLPSLMGPTLFLERLRPVPGRGVERGAWRPVIPLP